MATYAAFFVCVVIVSSCLALVRQGRLPQTVLSSLFLMVLLGLLVFMWHVSDPPEIFSDFTQAYYPAGHAIMHDVSRLYNRLSDCEETAVCGFVNIPAIAFVFTPLSFLKMDQAQLVFAGLSLMCVVVSYYGLITLTAATGWRRWAIASLFVANGPLFYSIREGNLTHVVLCLIVLAFVCLERDEEVWAGALVACAAIIKLPLGLLGVYFLLKGRWRIVTGMGLAFLVIIGTSLLWAGWESHVTWYHESIFPFASKGLAAFNVQSVDGFLLRLQEQPLLYDWKPVQVEWGVWFTRTVLVGLFFVISGLVLRGDAMGDPKDLLYVELSVVLCLALIVSPISWTHYYLFLLVPLSLYVGERFPVRQSWQWALGMVVCFLLVSPPVVFVDPSSSWFGNALGKLLLSHYVFGALLLWGLLCTARWRATHANRSSVLILTVPFRQTMRS